MSGCTGATLRTYERWIEQCISTSPAAAALEVHRFFVRLQTLSASSQHQAYRTLKTFFRWCVETGVLDEADIRTRVLEGGLIRPEAAQTSGVSRSTVLRLLRGEGVGQVS